METIEQMWQKFEAHQPKADELGYGEAWRKMCEERTKTTAFLAATAAFASAGAARVVAAWAADAADAGAWADAAGRAAAAAAETARVVSLAADAAAGTVDAEDAAEAEWWTKRAMDYINKAEGKYANS